jgi:hypothetical protein
VLDCCVCRLIMASKGECRASVIDDTGGGTNSTRLTAITVSPSVKCIYPEGIHNKVLVPNPDKINCPSG